MGALPFLTRRPWRVRQSCFQQLCAPQDAHDVQRKTASQSHIGAKSGAGPLLILANLRVWA